MFNSLKVKISLFFGILLVANILIVSYFSFHQSFKLVSNTFANRTQSLSQKASSSINPADFQKIVAEILKAPDSDANKKRVIAMPEYQRIHDQLHIRLDAGGLRYMYTMIELPDKRMMYVVDGSDITSDDFSQPGDIETGDYPQLRQALET